MRRSLGSAMGRFAKRFPIFSATLLVALPAHAAAPTLDYLFPAGGGQGTEVGVTLGGKFEPWPVSFWADAPGLEFKTDAKNGSVTIRIAKDAPTGPHFVRVFNESGASAPRWFVVTSHRELMEQEPNDTARQAQDAGPLPVVFNGRLDERGDVDSFNVKTEAGRWLVARVDAYSLGSPLDAVLHLYDSNGVRMAFNHDGPQGLDPFLAWRVAKSGTYTFQISGFIHPPQAEVRFAGSAASIYRLSLTDGEFAAGLFPSGAKRGEKVSLKKIGWNIPAGAGERVKFAAGKNSDATNLVLNGGVSRAPLPLDDWPEVIEAEPNDSATNAQRVTWPAIVNGVIARPGDEDCFTFAAKKGDGFEFRVLSAAFGFPLATSVKIFNSGGEPLAKADDAEANSDARLAWRAPRDGDFTVSVSDLFGNGGENFVYRLYLGPPQPDFALTTTEHTVRLEPGKTNELKVTLTRANGHTNRLTFAVEGLPAGVTATPTELPAKGGEIKIALVAAADAAPANQPFRVVAKSADTSWPRERAALFSLRAGEVPRAPRIITETDQLWLTVVPKGVTAEAPKSAPKKKKGAEVE
ncbi:MAG: hypothetical protein HY301_10410 [Verrucomicrobia bacterium]|nr:hypothetical protein [Verrucomicrobiota bacterium]